MNRTFTPCLSCRSLSACRTCLVKSSETALVSLSYRRGATRFLTRVRGVWPSLNRILQSSSTRQTLMRLMPSATFGSSDHSRNVWSPDRCRSTALPGLAILNGLAANLDWPAAVLDWPAAVLDWPGAVSDWPAAVSDWPGAVLDWPGAVSGWPGGVSAWPGGVSGGRG